MEGSAPIIGNNKESARRRAIQNAREKAVSRVVGTDISTEYLWANFRRNGSLAGAIPFVTRVIFEEGEIERDVEVRISDTSAEAHEIGIGEARVRFGRGCTHLRVRHSHAIDNPTQQVFYIPKRKWKPHIHHHRKSDHLG